jgi:membrane protein DedA with SNARE-associated domain
MSQLFLTLLTFFQAYGYPSLWVTVFVAAVGVPLPINLLLLASGAFAALGDFNVVLLALIGVTASICGDNIGYWLGRTWGSKGLSWLERSHIGKRLLPADVVTRSHSFFARHGGWAVFLSRFLVGALGGVINIVAGSELFSYRVFLICDVAGEILGVVLPLILGLTFGASWEALGTVLSTLSLVLLSLLVSIFLLLHLLKYIRRDRATLTPPAVDNLQPEKEEPEKWTQVG